MVIDLDFFARLSADGGNTESQAVGCSGGRRDDGCFSTRLMWRSQGKGEFYTYFPPSASANQKLCKVPPSSHCNPTYGASVGTGSFSFATGRWTTVAERVKLNDVGQANGEIELFVDGKSVINVNGLVLRTSNAGKFRGMQMQTFFGGKLFLCFVEQMYHIMDLQLTKLSLSLLSLRFP